MELLNNMADFPRYQYSEFLKGERDGQIVIRADTKEEFEEAKKYIDKIFTKHTEPIQDTRTTQAPSKTAKPIHIEKYQEVCEKCGAKKIMSKKGNMVCSAFCWTKK